MGLRAGMQALGVGMPGRWQGAPEEKGIGEWVTASQSLSFPSIKWV